MLLLPSQQLQQDHFSNSLLSLLATLCRLPSHLAAWNRFGIRGAQHAPCMG